MLALPEHVEVGGAKDRRITVLQWSREEERTLGLFMRFNDPSADRVVSAL